MATVPTRPTSDGWTLTLFTEPEELIDRFDAMPTRESYPQYQIGTGEDVAVIRKSAPEIIDFLRWGLIPRWRYSPESGAVHPTAPIETLSEKAVFKDSFEHRRCLVIIDGFLVWKPTDRGRTLHHVTLEDDSPFAVAGIWDRWETDHRTEVSISIVTTEAPDRIRHLAGRMPMILSDEGRRIWLDHSNLAQLKSLAAVARREPLHTYRLTEEVDDEEDERPVAGVGPASGRSRDGGSVAEFPE